MVVLFFYLLFWCWFLKEKTTTKEKRPTWSGVVCLVFSLREDNKQQVVHCVTENMETAAV